MNVDSRNIVIVFEQFNKDCLKYDALRSLIQGETPSILDTPIPLSPVSFNYTRANLGITFIANQLQIQTSAPEDAKATRDFPNIACQVLESMTSMPSIIAFGFNFNYTVAHMSNRVHEIVQLPDNLTTNDKFTFIPETYIKLSYESENIKYYIDVQDSGVDILVHINVHHEGPLKVDDLKGRMDEYYTSACDNSLQLVREVIKNANCG